MSINESRSAASSPGTMCVPPRHQQDLIRMDHREKGKREEREEGRQFHGAPILGSSHASRAIKGRADDLIEPLHPHYESCFSRSISLFNSKLNLA